MLPDFSKPAFSFVALCTIRFRDREDGTARKIHSDYRCQLCYIGSATTSAMSEARVYLVGREHVTSGEDVPAVLTFLDWEAQQHRCHAGTQFELLEGGVVTAVGTVHSIVR